MRTYTFPGYVRDALESDRCALISQFDPELTWQTHAAVTRNATIAALSKLVCVVEPKRMGGSMRTARNARDQGKPVYFYCDPGERTLSRTLRQSGAHELLAADHAIDFPALRACWDTAPRHLPEQAEFS
ncbi:MAG: hypothetical protein FJY92_00005 [Candidatus Hydrogenedentes bacterium]|nr:hypothetical protein [Candidatus Hydrogenedentota bacterium]